MLKFLRKYGEATTITFGLREPDGIVLKSDAICVDGDVVIMKDEGAEANVDADFADEGTGYSLAFSAVEITAARIQGYIEDQGTPVWLGREFLIETYGHPNAQHPYFGEGVWDRVLTGATHNVPASSGRRLRQLAGNIYDDGTAQAGGVNNITLAAGASATDGIYFQTYLAIVGGTGAGQGHHVVGYNGTTKVATMDDDWVVQPDNTSEYILYGSGSHEAIEEGTVAGATNDTITLNSYSPVTDDAYINYHISIISGTGNRQTRRIIDYDGTTKVATIKRAWDINPTNSSGYWIERAGLNVNDIWDEVLTSSTHNVTKSAGKRLRELLEIAGYEGGFIYYDSTGGGSAGSTPFENGILDDPVDNMADLNILLAELPFCCIKVTSGSSITFAEAQEYQSFIGENWTLALGGQDINALFVHGADVSGIGIALTSKPKFEDCEINGVTISPSIFKECGYSGGFIAGAPGDYFFTNDSHSRIAGIVAPDFSYNAAIGPVNFNFRGYHGGQEIKEMRTGDNLSFDGDGQIIINADSSGGTMRISGHQNLTGAEAFIAAGGFIYDDARFATDQLSNDRVTVLSATGYVKDVYWASGGKFKIKESEDIDIPFWFEGNPTGLEIWFVIAQDLKNGPLLVKKQLIEGTDWNIVQKDGVDRVEGGLPFVYADTDALHGEYTAAAIVRTASDRSATGWESTLIVSRPVAKAGVLM